MAHFFVGYPGSGFYYALVAYVAVRRRGIVLVDAYNIFIFFFSVLIVQGVLAASQREVI